MGRGDRDEEKGLRKNAGVLLPDAKEHRITIVVDGSQLHAEGVRAAVEENPWCMVAETAEWKRDWIF